MMTLWERTLRILGATVILMATALYAGQRLFIQGSAADLERSDTERSVRQALAAIDREVQDLETVAQGWAAWDETYRFAADSNDAYIQDNLLDQGLYDRRLNLILIADSAGSAVYVKTADWALRRPVSISTLSSVGPSPLLALLTQEHAGGGIAGLVMLSGGPLLVASRPILTSAGEGPTRGDVLVGRLLDEAVLDALAATTQATLRVRRADDAQWPASFAEARSALSAGGDVWVKPLSEQSVAGYAWMEDIGGQRGLMLQVEQPRDVYQYAQGRVRYLGVAVVGAAFVFFFVGLLLFEVSVLSRVNELGEQVDGLRQRGELGERVHLSGRDELTALGERINAMLAELQQAQESARRRQKHLEGLVQAAQSLLAPSPDIAYEPFLRAIGEAADARRVYVFRLHRDAGGAILGSQTARWRAPGVESMAGAPALVDFPVLAGGLGRWLDLFSRGEVIQGRVAELPASERAVLEAQGVESVLALPLILDGAVVGVIGFDLRPEAQAWQPAQLDLLRVAAADLTQALKRQQGEHVQAAIYRISEAAHSVENLPELYRSIHQILGTLMPAQNFYIAMYDPLRELLSFPYFVDEFEQPPPPSMLGKGLTEYVLRTGQPLLASPDVFQRLLQNGDVEQVGPMSIDWVGAPLKLKDRTIGVLGMQSYTEGVRYSERDRDILNFVSTQVAMAIERKRSEEALRQSEEQYRLLIERQGEGLVVVDLKEHVLLCNPAGDEIFGVSRGTLVGRNLRDFTSSETFRFLQEQSKKRRAGEKSTYEAEIIRPDGERRTLLVTAAPWRDRDGRIVGAFSIFRDDTERKGAVELLRQSEERYRMLFEVGGTGRAIIEEDTTISLVNNEFERLSGLSREQLLGRSFKELVPPEELKRVLDYHQRRRADAASVPERYEFTWQDGQGNVRDLLVSVGIVPGTHRTVVSLLDITERKRTEEELRQVMDFSEGIVRGVAEGLLLEDPSGAITFVNPALEALLGYTSAQLIGKPWQSIVSPDEVSQVEARASRRPQGVSEQYETRLRARDGREVAVVVNARPLFEEGRFAGVLSAFTDISERVRAESALRDSEERYRTLMENIPIGVCRIQRGKGGRFLMANRAFLAMLGVDSEEQLRQLAATDLGSGREPFSALVQRLLREGAVAGQELQMRRVDGSPIWVSLTAKVVREGKGTEAAYLDCVLEDLTARKQAEQERERLEEQLRHVQRLEAVGLLAGGVAHEFNNLLTVVQGNAELALAELDESSTLYPGLCTIQKAARRGAALTQQLLAFSRRRPLQPQVLNLNEVLHDFSAMLTPVVGTSVELCLESDPGIGPVFGDSSALEQVVLNLALNARDAMPDGGVLHIATAPAVLDDDSCRAIPQARPGRYVCLTVADTGVGMDEATVERLFQPFFTTKDVGKGSGLGLPTVYGIVRQHGGFIDVHSQVGQGTQFDIYLPVHVTEA